MATVTVESAHATTVTLTYDSNANAALAQYVANAIQAGISGGTLLAEASQFGMPPITSGKTGEWVETTPSPTTLTSRYDFIVDSSTTTANVTAPDDPNVQIIAGSGHLTLNTFLGSGSLIAGDGKNAIVTPVTSSGHWSFILGDGNNTVKALGSGADTISLGAGNNVVTTNGATTVNAGSGAETITGAGTTLINGSSIGGTLTFLGTGGGATVFGGAGSDTLSGRNGPDYFQGGTGGNNSIVAGAGAATLFGGGSGDQLFANGKGLQILRAGTGNETLTGSSVGGGSDTFVASQGTTAVLVTPLDSNLFEFILGSAGGTMTEYGLTSIEQLDIHLSGYASNSLGSVASQNNSGGNLNITLTDGTQITFENLTHPLTNANFS
jgi:hypothetical protein